MTQSIILRPANISDAQRLFEWRNDPMTRAMSRSPESIRYQDHLAWLERRLAEAPPHLYIAEIDGEAFGTYRLDGDEISFAIAPAHRGRGLCSAMLKLVRQIHGPLRAVIKPANLASIRAATAAGLPIELMD